MTGPPLLIDLALILLGATVLVLAARAVGAPSIVAYLLAGLALGPLLGLLAVTETLDLIAEVGIALLLFLVGLELSLDKVRAVGRVSVLAGLGQVVFTAAGGFGLCLLLNFSLVEALFIATALTFSSTVVVVKLLDQKGDLNSLYGRIAVGIFLVQDLVVIVALTFLAGLARPEDLEPGTAVRGLLVAFGGMGLLLAAAIAAARWVLPRLFGWVSRSLEAMFIWSLCWCFAFVLGAELMNLSLEIGAFLAGVSLAQLPYNQELRRRVRPLMNFFIAVFFVTLGVRMELADALFYWREAGILSLFVLLGNPLIFMIIIARSGYEERTSFLTSVTVAQISEFSFIFAAMGLTAGLIGEAILAVIAAVGLVTIAVSAYMILYNEQLYGLMRRLGVLRLFGAAVASEEVPELPVLRDHVIVVGMNALGRRLVRELVARSERVLAIDTDPVKLQDLPCDTLLGNVDHIAVLDEAELDRAKLVISALQIEGTNNLLAYRCRERGIPCSIHAFDESVVRSLGRIGADHLIVSKNAGVQELAARLADMGLIGS